MSQEVPSECQVCSQPFNDNKRLPLTTTCGHTTCATCLREVTLQCHPGAATGKEGTVPTGKKIECQQCHKTISTDQLVINRVVLAKIPLSLDDLILDDYEPRDQRTTRRDPSPSHNDTEPQDDSQPPPQDELRPDSPVQRLENDPLTPPAGWSSPLKMDPNQIPQHGGLGWGAPVPPTYQPHPQVVPQHPPAHHGGAPYPAQVPYPHPQQHPHHPHPHPHHPHHPHHPQPSHGPGWGGAAMGVAAGVVGGAAVGALATSHKKKNKDKKHKKAHKKDRSRRHRSDSGSSSSGSSSGSSSSGSSSSRKKGRGRKHKSSSSGSSSD